MYLQRIGRRGACLVLSVAWVLQYQPPGGGVGFSGPSVGQVC